MINFFKNLFTKEDIVIQTPDKDFEKPFDEVRISVLRSDYEKLKKDLLKCKTTIKDQKKKIASLKKK